MSNKNVNVPNQQPQNENQYSEENLKKYEDHLLEEAKPQEEHYPLSVKLVVVLLVAIIVLGVIAGAVIVFS